MNAPIWQSAWDLARHLEGGRARRLVLTSGGFSPLHRGHVRCMESSAALGDCLVVAVMADTWLTRKTGRAFMEFADRAAVVAALRGVDHVVCWDDGTPFVDGLIRILRPRIFAKGGDRSTAAAIAAPERDACRQCGTFLALGVGGTDKVQSSSVILSRARIP